MVKKRDWAGEIYSGEAEFGRINAAIGAVVLTVFGVIFIIAGIVMMVIIAKNTRKKKSKKEKDFDFDFDDDFSEARPAIWIGLIPIIFGILMIALGWGWFYATRKSKAAAAIGGTAATVGIFRDALLGK